MGTGAESLFECLAEIPDPRKARGIRHPFQAVLRLTLLGLVSGQTTMAHLVLFGEKHWARLKEPLGFTRDRPPHATTISRTLAGVSFEQLQRALIGWVEGIVKDQPCNPATPRWTGSGLNSRQTQPETRWRWSMSWPTTRSEAVPGPVADE